MRIGIDIDDTVTETAKKFRKFILWYVRQNKLDYYKEKGRLKEADYNQMMELYGEEIYLKLKLKSGAKKYLNRLKQDHTLIYITARSKKEIKNIETYTKIYFENHEIPYDEICFNAKNKGKVAAKKKIDIIIDDREDFLDSVQPDILKIRMTESHQNYSKYRKVTNWKKFYEIVKEESAK